MSEVASRGWRALELARSRVEQEARHFGVDVHRVEFVATFEPWDKCTEAYVFYSTDDELHRSGDAGIDERIETALIQALRDADYPFEAVPSIKVYFDSHENVVRNFEGSYFYRLR